MRDVTLILQRIEQGSGAATEDLFPLVYDELRRIAARKMSSERSDHTLSATSLVHEAYVRLVDVEALGAWKSRRHFVAAAAEAMRRILIDHARKNSAAKRGGGCTQIDADLEARTTTDPDLLLDLNEGLERLANEDAEAAELVKLRLFAGLSVAEAGELLGMSRSAAFRNWEYVRSWFDVYSSTSSD